MRHIHQFRRALGVVFVSTIFITGSLFSQDLSQIGKQKPFTVTGSIGTSNSFYTTNSHLNYRAPVSNNLYANLNFSIYGIDIPLAFYYSNNNRGFSHPFLNYGMSPKYKALQLHLGYRSMSFSPMVYQHQTFLGIGADFHWKIIRLGAFKGSLNQARNMGDETPRPSVFHRDALGFKAGIGSSKNFVDLMVFGARDDTLTIADTAVSNRLLPKENIVAGTRMQFSLGRSVTIMADIAASGFNDDARMEEVVVEQLAPLDPWFKLRSGSRVSYAGDIRAMVRFGRTNTMFQYKRVHPEYYSLGVPYFANNLELAGININTSMFKNRVMLSGSFFGQQDNLLRNQLYTNRNLVFNGTSTVRVHEGLNLTLSYNGYSQYQMDGTAQIEDSLRINRLNQNISLIPNYVIQKEQHIHTISGNLTSTQNLDQNPMTSVGSDQQTITGGLQYFINLKKSKYQLGANWNHTETSAPMFDFNSDNLGFSVGKRFLKEENLNLQARATLVFTNVEWFSRNRSLVNSLTASYVYKKSHSITLRLNYNRLNNYNLTADNVLNGQDLLISFSYNYRFKVFDKERSSGTGETGPATSTPKKK